MTFGIDISKWQAGIDFDKVKAEGVEFVILRGADHLTIDTCFNDFYSACKDRNIPVGVYHYSRAINASQAIQEAKFLIENVLSKKQFEFPVFVDIEDTKQMNLSKSVLDSIIKAYCDTVNKAGYICGFYTSESWYNKKISGANLAKEYYVWIAKWNKEKPQNISLNMWQFGGETNVIRSSKIAGKVVDQNYCFTDFVTLVKAQGLNGFSKPVDYRKRVKERGNFEEQTMKFFDSYKYADALYQRLATMK